MQSSNAYNTYKNNSVNHASKDQLLLMLVEGAVKFAKTSRQAILDKDIQRAHENSIKAQNIFYELMISLDVEKGGEWAANLYKVYDFLIVRLRDANMKKSVEIMNEIMPIIEDVRDTWNEAYKLSKGIK
jgi:flagellar protein FliS